TRRSPRAHARRRRRVVARPRLAGRRDGRRGRARSRRAGRAAGGGVTARRPASGAPPLVVGAPAPRRGGSRPRRRRSGPRPGGVSRRALLPRRRCAARGRARGRAALMAYGRYFEEFTVGEVLRHWPGRTINEADCTWFALLTMNQHPVHSDAHYVATHTQHGQRLVLGPLVFSIGIGMTVADVSGKAIANLEIEKITHEAPTFIGDTLYSESTVLETRESKQGDRGTVTVQTRVSNQGGERVMTFKRTALLPKK